VLTDFAGALRFGSVTKVARWPVDSLSLAGVHQQCV